MFASSFITLFSLAPFLPPIFAAPTPLFGITIGSGTETNSTPTAVSQSTINGELLRPALFARTGYCSSTSIKSWSCGAPCEALPGVSVYTSGGDQGEIPYYYVANDPQSQSVVVVHEGTDLTSLLSDLNDIEFSQVAINTTLFLGVSSSVLVHDGFQQTQERTADIILSTVKSAISSTGYTNVLVTGHSLGAAIASLDAVMLKMNLPSSVTVSSVVFGLPRVGNQAWADLVDSMLPSFSHVTNQNDPVPNVPPHFLSYQHPAGEVHIKSVDASTGDATMVDCGGQENSNCSAGNSLLDVSVTNHLGPYFSEISMGSSASGCS